MDSKEDFQPLKLTSTIGYNGHVKGGILIHPDRNHMIYPVGCQIVIRNLNDGKQSFLRGHENNIACIAMSNTGKYIASGQVTYMGFRAPVIIWSYEKKALMHRLSMHKVKVEALAFSPFDTYLATVGGQDDCNLVVWDVKTGKTVCGAASTLKQAGNVYAMAFTTKDENKFVSGGDGNLRVWQIDAVNHKLLSTDCNIGKMRRVINCIEIDADDKYAYCSTSSGDIVKLNIQTTLMANIGPVKQKAKFDLGVTYIKLLKTGNLLVGTGSGKVCVVKTDSDRYPIIKDCCSKVEGEVSALSLRGEGHQFFVGTKSGHVNRFNLVEFTQEPIITAPSSGVDDVAFPSGSSQLFATCSGSDIRIWHTETSRELLRIVVPNLQCTAIMFTEDGQTLLSAWTDSKIRAFLPESGKPYYTIHNAHHAGVFSLNCTKDCKRIVSGGGEGQVRVWEVVYQPLSQTFVAAMKEHTTKVTCIKLSKDNRECVSASADGTCIIWDLVTFRRKQMVLSSSQYQCVIYHPKLPQIVTSGTDRKIVYWETIDGGQIRELEGSKSGSINGMDICPKGQMMVTGGDDRLIKVWDYDNGTVSHVGIGHSGNIRKVRICPNLQYIVSCSQDGAVLIWKYPQ